MEKQGGKNMKRKNEQTVDVVREKERERESIFRE